jgi:hypothetical protein
MKDCGINMTDNKIEDIAFEVDTFIFMMINKYGLDPLILSSVMTARLVLANDATGSGDDFRKLLEKIPAFKPNKALRPPVVTAVPAKRPTAVLLPPLAA